MAHIIYLLKPITTISFEWFCEWWYDYKLCIYVFDMWNYELKIVFRYLCIYYIWPFCFGFFFCLPSMGWWFKIKIIFATKNHCTHVLKSWLEPFKSKTCLFIIRASSAYLMCVFIDNCVNMPPANFQGKISLITFWFRMVKLT